MKPSRGSWRRPSAPARTRQGEAGRALAELHRAWLSFGSSPYDPARHRGLAELYVQDERFTAYYDKSVPGCARFLRDAVLSHVPAAE